ncbi:helix-turn-helix domain-containing protein [Enterococcus sp. AZ194]|uniref:helix-turn-helix domain-containing protein n=1 Tax=Enterococcus sp. AZ194 TaxID=2774629 RepID=UPI003F686C2E
MYNDAKYLNNEERIKIEAWRQLEPSVFKREIARLLGRVPQTIYTEIKEGFACKKSI